MAELSELSLLIIERDRLLHKARSKTNLTIIGALLPTGDDAADIEILRTEIDDLSEFIGRPTPGLHTDTVDTTEEDDDPTNT
jgi:hypothetical protein